RAPIVSAVYSTAHPLRRGFSLKIGRRMHARTYLTSILFLGFLTSSSAQGGGMDRAKIALHVQAHTTKGVCSTSSPTIPCAEYRTSGDVGVSYDVYVVVADILPS